MSSPSLYSKAMRISNTLSVTIKVLLWLSNLVLTLAFILATHSKQLLILQLISLVFLFLTTEINNPMLFPFYHHT